MNAKAIREIESAGCTPCTAGLQTPNRSPFPAVTHSVAFEVGYDVRISIVLDRC